MNRILIAAALLATIQLVSAQEKLSREEALPYAKAVSADLKQLNGTPIATDVDTQQPVAVKEEQYGGMVLPQKNLREETIGQVGTTPLPIGQLWLLKLTLIRDGFGIPGDQLRLVTVKHDGDETMVPQCALGIQRNDAGALELLVYGKDKVPLLKVPLKKMEARQESPIDISAERNGDEGSVTLKILGKYEAKLLVTELEL